MDLKKPLVEKAPAGRPGVLASVYDVLEGNGVVGRLYQRFTTALILVNVGSFIVSTEPAYSGDEHRAVFEQIELVSVLIFSVEYLLRFWSVVAEPEFASGNPGIVACLAYRIRWAFGFFSLVDLASILPFYVDFLIPGGKNIIATQWVRVARLLRLLPPLPYADIWKKSSKLLLASGFAGFTVWVICASLYYFFERDNPKMQYCVEVDGEKECWSYYHSIPAAMYYSLMNFFGEFPLADNHNIGGRFVAAFIQMCGAAVMAIPAGALGNAFSDVVEDIVDDDDEDDEEGKEDKAGQLIVRAPEMSEAWQCLNGEQGVRCLGSVEPLQYIDAGDFCKYTTCGLALASCLHFILSSLHSQPANLGDLIKFLSVLDVLGTVVFLAEYGYRFATATGGGYSSPLAYALSGYGLVDCLSALSGLRWAYPGCAWLRASTSLRILKMERYVGAFKNFGEVIYNSRSIFAVTGGAAMIMWVFFSTIMYYAERGNPDPDMARHYSSVSEASWVTLLNLSGEAPLGDYTVLGKLITSFMGLVGVGFVTIPMGVLGSGFQDLLEDDDEEDEDAPAATPATKESALLQNEDEQATGRQLVFKFLQGSAANQVDDMNPWERRAVRFEQVVFLGIFLSVVSTACETVKGFAPEGSLNHAVIAGIEVLATLLFTVEYGLRYYAAPEDEYWRQQGYVTDSAARFAHTMSLAAVIDFIAIAPFYATLCGSTLADRYDGELRMLRVFRLLTLDKYIPSVSLIGNVFRKNAEQFRLAAYAAAALWMIFTSLLWLTERHDDMQVDDLTMGQRYTSMVSSLPYTMVHLTGDYPLIDYNLPARCVLFFALLFAVGVVSVPTGLLASGFTKELQVYRKEQQERKKAAASKIEKAIKGYMIRRRLRKAVFAKLDEERNQARLKKLAEREGSKKHQLLKFQQQKTTAGRIWKKCILVLIILNVLAVIFESMHSVKDFFGQPFLDKFEFVSVTIFTFEYLGQVWTANVNQDFMFQRRQYIFSFFGVVDLITVAPFWIEQVLFLMGIPFSAMVFRIARLLRILQLEDFVESFTLLDDAWYKCKDSMYAAGFMALLVWVCGSVLFYEFEKDNPRMEGSFDSLPSSMYYCAIFLGGEWAKVDFTPAGQVVCIFYCLIGIAIYGIPVGALFEAFGDVLDENEEGDGDEEPPPAEPALPSMR